MIETRRKEDYHKQILKTCAELGPFLVEKNKAYGDASRKIVRALQEIYPEGIPVSQIGNAYYMIQILNKLSRVAEDNDPFGEDPWLDSAGYSVLAHAKRLLESKKETADEIREASSIPDRQDPSNQ